MSTPTPWEAPLAPRPVVGRVVVPGSKSATARALVLAGLAAGESTLRGVLASRDSRLMRAGLEALGVGFSDLGPDAVRVTPADPLTAGSIDVGLSGTVLRFLAPLAGLATGPTIFDGDPHMSARPIGPLLDALGAAGVRVDYAGSLPFTIAGTGRVTGGRIEVDASASSQFVSGLLLAAARFDEGLDLRHVGGPIPSQPHIDMTVTMLRQRGVAVSDAPGAWRVDAGAIAARDTDIEPDLTNTAAFLAAGMATGGRVTAAWPSDSLQAADRILAVLSAFGATIEHGTDEVTVGAERLTGADIDLSEVSELTPVAAALAALAAGPSRLRGVAHIRGHETDRLAALERELSALGCRASQTADGLAITPAPLHGGLFATYADHRIAHAGAILGLVVPDVRLDDVACTSKTLDDFPALWHGLVAP